MRGHARCPGSPQGVKTRMSLAGSLSFLQLQRQGSDLICMRNEHGVLQDVLALDWIGFGAVR